MAKLHVSDDIIKFSSLIDHEKFILVCHDWGAGKVFKSSGKIITYQGFLQLLAFAMY